MRPSCFTCANICDCSSVCDGTAETSACQIIAVFESQVNTFGGQIMAWMVNVATIAARYSHKHVFPSYFYLKIGCTIVTFDLHILISVVQPSWQIKGSVQLCE